MMVLHGTVGAKQKLATMMRGGVAWGGEHRKSRRTQEWGVAASGKLVLLPLPLPLREHSHHLTPFLPLRKSPNS